MNTNNISTLNIITKCTIFEFMRYFFCDPEKYAQLTNKVKQTHCFMFYRLMSIKYPIQMNAISNIHDSRIIDTLHDTFGNSNNQYPGWLYQKTIKQSNSEKQLNDILSKDEINQIFEVFDIEYKSLLMLYELFPDVVNDLKNEIKEDDNKIMKKKIKVKK